MVILAVDGATFLIRPPTVRFVPIKSSLGYTSAPSSCRRTHCSRMFFGQARLFPSARSSLNLEDIKASHACQIVAGSAEGKGAFPRHTPAGLVLGQGAM